MFPPETYSLSVDYKPLDSTFDIPTPQSQAIRTPIQQSAVNKMSSNKVIKRRFRADVMRRLDRLTTEQVMTKIAKSKSDKMAKIHAMKPSSVDDQKQPKNEMFCGLMDGNDVQKGKEVDMAPYMKDANPEIAYFEIVEGVYSVKTADGGHRLLFDFMEVTN